MVERTKASPRDQGCLSSKATAVDVFVSFAAVPCVQIRRRPVPPGLRSPRRPGRRGHWQRDLWASTDGCVFFQKPPQKGGILLLCLITTPKGGTAKQTGFIKRKGPATKRRNSAPNFTGCENSTRNTVESEAVGKLWRFALFSGRLTVYISGCLPGDSPKTYPKREAVQLAKRGQR